MFSLSPNSYYQALFYLSLLLTGYGLLRLTDTARQKSQDFYYIQLQRDSISNELKEDSVNDVIEEAKYKYLSEKSKKVDSILKSLIRSDTAQKRSIEYFTNESNSASSAVEESINRGLAVSLKRVRSKQALNSLNSHTEQNTADIKRDNLIHGCYVVVGIVLLLFSAFQLEKTEIINNQIKLSEEYKKGRIWLWCQSCGKNFSAKRSHSKNADGSTNFAFCTACYTNGHYTDPNLTWQDIWANYQAIINATTTSPKEKKKLTKHFTKRLQSLDRWDQNEYKKTSVESYLNV